MSRRLTDPRPCRQEDCDTTIVLALRMPAKKWVPYEAEARSPESVEAVGCHVLIGQQAWQITDLIEDFQVRHELDENTARDLVAGYPYHRPHHHPKEQ